MASEANSAYVPASTGRAAVVLMIMGSILFLLALALLICKVHALRRKEAVLSKRKEALEEGAEGPVHATVETPSEIPAANANQTFQPPHECSRAILLREASGTETVAQTPHGGLPPEAGASCSNVPHTLAEDAAPPQPAPLSTSAPRYPTRVGTWNVVRQRVQTGRQFSLVRVRGGTVSRMDTLRTVSDSAQSSTSFQSSASRFGSTVGSRHASDASGSSDAHVSQRSAALVKLHGHDPDADVPEVSIHPEPPRAECELYEALARQYTPRVGYRPSKSHEAAMQRKAYIESMSLLREDDGTLVPSAPAKP